MTSAVANYNGYPTPPADTAFGQYKIHEQDTEPTYNDFQQDYAQKQPEDVSTDKLPSNDNNRTLTISTSAPDTMTSATNHHGLMITTSTPVTASDNNDGKLMISGSTPLALTKKTPELLKSTSTHSDENENECDDDDENESILNGSRPDHMKARLCTVPDCRKRVRSKGLCKAHGGGRRCMVEGCERSSQGQGLCIRHGGGKRCTQVGCTKASQSNGLCKAHGGGLRCQFENCTKSSQGGGFCRAHGGGQRCEKEGCNKGAQRGGFCAGHGGSRFCQHPDCTKNDRGGGHCAEHGGGKRCGEPGCNKPARKKGKCSHHANNKTKLGKEGMAGVVPTMMDMRQITAPVYNMPVMLKDDMDHQSHHRGVYPPMMGYPRGNEYAKGYDHPLPLNTASNHYLAMHNDHRGYEHLGMQLHHAAPRHYLGPSPTAYKHPHPAPYNAPVRDMMKPNQSNYSQQQWPPKAPYYDMKDSHQGYAPAPQYAQHMPSSDVTYGSQRDYYPLHTSASADGNAPSGSNMMYYNNYAQHPLHSMDLL